MRGEATLCDFCTLDYPSVARQTCIVCSRDFCSDHGDERLLILTSHNGKRNPISIPINQAAIQMQPNVPSPILLDVSLLVCIACCDTRADAHARNGTLPRVVSTLGAAVRDGLAAEWRAGLSELALKK